MNETTKAALRYGSIVGLTVIWATMAVHPGQNDLWQMIRAWTSGGSLYPVGFMADPTDGKYGYAPIWAQAFRWLGDAPWPVVSAAWDAIQIGLVVWMVGPVLGLLAFVVPPFLPEYGNSVYASIAEGNPFILTAAAIVVSFRFAPAWAWVLLSKSTAGIGVLWYVVRREWRNLALALGTTAALAGLSFVLSPRDTFDWIGMWLNAASTSASGQAVTREMFVPVAMPIRWAVGVVVVLWAARTNRPWLLVVGCFLALPDIQLGGFALLVAAPALWLRRSGDRVEVVRTARDEIASVRDDRDPADRRRGSVVNV